MNDNQDMFHPEEEKLDELNTFRPEEPVEESIFHEEHTEPQSQEPGIYRGRGAGRKESPFADSPYVMNHRPTYQEPEQPRAERYEPRQEYVPRKKKKGGVGRKILACVAALALVVTSCGVTAHLVNRRWEDRTEAMEAAFSN